MEAVCLLPPLHSVPWLNRQYTNVQKVDSPVEPTSETRLLFKARLLFTQSSQTPSGPTSQACIRGPACIQGQACIQGFTVYSHICGHDNTPSSQYRDKINNYFTEKNQSQLCAPLDFAYCILQEFNVPVACYWYTKLLQYAMLLEKLQI